MPVDLYCERTGPEFWAEPINALTNAAFLLAAWAIWSTSNRTGAGAPATWLLWALAAAIGAGSFVFHTVATSWARPLDVIPILLFQLVFLWLYARWLMGWRRLPAALLLLGFFAAAIAGRQFPHVLNGSLIYASALLAVIALAIYHLATASVGRFDLVAATAAFAAALWFRTLDDAVCTDFPTGSHFMWHLLNGLVVYLAARAIIRQPQPLGIAQT